MLRPSERSHEIQRIAIVGVGNELRGDDSAGLVVARALKTALASNERTLAIDAGSAPENHTGSLRHFQPDVTLFVDAAQMDEAPGVVKWLTWEGTEGISASTHTLPLYILAKYLVSELGCEVALLCIQPANDVVGAPLSLQVAEAVDSVVDVITRVVQNHSLRIGSLSPACPVDSTDTGGLVG
jgi:hydrogenase maturation protease HycI